jgi:hypothetical protein
MLLYLGHVPNLRPEDLLARPNADGRRPTLRSVRERCEGVVVSVPIAYRKCAKRSGWLLAHPGPGILCRCPIVYWAYLALAGTTRGVIPARCF